MKRRKYMIQKKQMEQVATMEQIVQFVKESSDEFILHVTFGEEAEFDAKKEPI